MRDECRREERQKWRRRRSLDEAVPGAIVQSVRRWRRRTERSGALRRITCLPRFSALLFIRPFGDIHSGQCCPNLPLLCVSGSATDGHLGGRWSWEQVGGGTIGAGRIRKCGMVGEEKEVKRSQQGQRTTHTPVPWRQGGVRGAETHLSPWGSRHWRGGGRDKLEGDGGGTLVPSPTWRAAN